MVPLTLNQVPPCLSCYRKTHVSDSYTNLRIAIMTTNKIIIEERNTAVFALLFLLKSNQWRSFSALSMALWQKTWNVSRHWTLSATIAEMAKNWGAKRFEVMPSTPTISSAPPKQNIHWWDGKHILYNFQHSNLRMIVFGSMHIPLPYLQLQRLRWKFQSLCFRLQTWTSLLVLKLKCPNMHPVYKMYWTNGRKETHTIYNASSSKVAPVMTLSTAKLQKAIYASNKRPQRNIEANTKHVVCGLSGCEQDPTLTWVGLLQTSNAWSHRFMWNYMPSCVHQTCRRLSLSENKICCGFV